MYTVERLIGSLVLTGAGGFVFWKSLQRKQDWHKSMLGTQLIGLGVFISGCISVSFAILNIITKELVASHEWLLYVVIVLVVPFVVSAVLALLLAGYLVYLERDFKKRHRR